MQPELAAACSRVPWGLLGKVESGCCGALARPLWGWLGTHTPPHGSLCWVWVATSPHPYPALPTPHPVCALPPGLALAFHDGSVHIVHRLSLQTMAVFYSSAAPRSVDEPAIKRPRGTGPAVHFKAMQLSWTSLALVGIDNHGKVSANQGLSEGKAARPGVGPHGPAHCP